MAKTLWQKSLELAEQNAELISRVAALEAKLSEQTALAGGFGAKVDELTAAVAAESAKVAELNGQLSAAAASVEQITSERDAAQAKVRELSATLALHPEVSQPEGRSALDLGAQAEAPADGPQSWPDALKACGNDYVAARRRFPKQFDAFMKEPK